MSKLIVEMDMPRNCDECVVGFGCAFCGITGSAFYGNTQMPNFMPDEQKLPDCPIKGVLPDEHGDLIDRDVLYMAVKSHNTSDAAIARNHNRVTSLQNLSTIRKGYIAEKHICLDDIIRAEAVIKAERKDDGTTVD